MKNKKRFSGILLSLAMVLGMSMTVYADDAKAYADYDVTTDTNKDKSGDDLTALQVTFNGTKWYVIKDNSTALNVGTVTLLAADTSFGNSKFNETNEAGNAYSTSYIKGVLDAYTSDGGSFADVADAIQTVKVKGSDNDAEVDAKLYLLSTVEAEAVPTNVRNNSFIGSSVNYYWRLRSPGGDDVFGKKTAAVVNAAGEILIPGSYAQGFGVEKEFGVRPALKLKLSSVIFSSETKKFLIKKDVTGVSLNKPEITLNVNDTKTLTATIEPADTETTATDKTVTWESSNIKVASVDSNGKITGVSEGEAIITVTTHEGSFTDTCKVTVKKDAPVTGECTITFDPNGGKGEMDPQTADKGDTIKLNANEFTRSGYAFKNWNTKADGSGDSYDDKASVKFNDDLTLYAQWKKDESKSDDADDDDDHDDESTSSNNNNTKVPDGCDELRQSLSSAIATATVSGKPQTIYWSKGTSLPYDVMKMLHDNPNITLVFSYTYLGQNYTVTIPGSAAIANPSVPWYGPVYLYALYGNPKTSVLTTNTKASTGNYTVESGDTLSAIAKRLKTTVKHLKDANNIKDVDKIKPGMVLKY